MKTEKERLSAAITQPQMAWLRSEAGSLGLSIGELMRRIIDQVRSMKDARKDRTDG